MNRAKQAIGIIDSGIGGFSVAKSVKKLLPKEDILYFGDGANAPYGNRSSQELTALATYMVDFMNQSQVKLLLVACNTISCLANTYEEKILSPVLYVVKSGASGIAQSNYQKIGVISTNFTHQQGMYAKSIQEIYPDKEVFSQGSTHLVRLIEENKGDLPSKEAIASELFSVISPLQKEGIECCVLGCTHYPLALDILKDCFPDLPFSDPAEEMARQAKALLADNNLLNLDGGKLTVFTSGDTTLQGPHLKRAGLVADSVEHITPLHLP